MRKRRLLAACLLAVIVLMAMFAAWYLTLPTPGVTDENLQRLQEGMTERAVAELLGSPGTFKGQSAGVFGDEFTIVEWRDANVVRVAFDKQGSLQMAAIVLDEGPPYSPEEPYVRRLMTQRETTLEKIRRWLHL